MDLLLGIAIEMGDATRYSLHAETTQQLMINTKCSDKEIFLYEPIKNVSDAADKRFERVTNKSKLDAQFIRLVPDKANKTLSFIDNGIGMTRNDLLYNLIRSYIKVARALAAGADISQLGIGYFSAYLVADKVVITTKYDHHDQYIMESHDSASRTIAVDLNGEKLTRGSKITLFLKEDQLEYLEEARIKDLVKKHCKFISHPIYLWTEKTTDKEIGGDEAMNEGFVKDVVDDEENNSKKMKNKDFSHEWQLINVWGFKPKETTKEECGLRLQAEMQKKFVGATSEKLRSCIPDDIAFSILSKLPLKSRKRFGCVSKSWALLFENPYFMSIFQNNFISNLHSYYDDTSLLLRQSWTDSRNWTRSSLFSLSGESRSSPGFRTRSN